MAGKEPGAEKLDKKQKETDHQEQSGGSAADHQEVVGPSRGKGTEPGVISAEEGRVFLEEEGFIDHTEQVDANALAGVLVQVTLMDGMALKARHAVRAVALMLGQLKSEDIGDAILMRVETKLDAMLGKAAEKQAAASVEAANAVGSVLEKSVEEIKLVARGMQDNTARLTESATKTAMCCRGWHHHQVKPTHMHPLTCPCIFKPGRELKLGSCLLISSRIRGLPHSELNCWFPSRQG